jgi:hypothetical protein
VLYHLSCSTSPVLDIFEIGSNYLPKLALNHDPPDLFLLSNKDYRCEPWHLAHICMFICHFKTCTFSSTLNIACEILEHFASKPQPIQGI